MQKTEWQLPPEWQGTIEENIQCGMSELWILSLLAERDMYTYEIRRELERRSDGILKLREGSMYGPMYRMKKRGLITAQQVTVGVRRTRTYYHLEGLGKAYLLYATERFRIISQATEQLLAKDTGIL